MVINGHPMSMEKLRRLARRGSIVWVALLLLTAGGSASQLFAAGHPRAVAQRSSEAPPTTTSTKSLLALLDGIPQHGDTLGDPAAPVELIEFADLQCPFCAAVNTVLLPQLVKDYVRPGQVKLVFRGLHFVGPDSERLGKTAEAMGKQDRLWQFVEVAFAHQGAENSGYATDTYVTKLLTEIPGANVEAALADRDSPAVTDALDRASHEADQLKVRGTPSFFLVKPGEPPREVQIPSLARSSFARELAATS